MLTVAMHDPTEGGEAAIVAEDRAGHATAGEALVRLEQVPDDLLIRGGQRLDGKVFRTGARNERATAIAHVGDAACHAGPEIPADRSEDHDRSTGHVFTCVVADPLDDRGRAAVAHGEALAG